MENENTCGPSCGCHTDRFSTNQKCPTCGARLALTGSLQKAEFHLTCSACGYYGPRLSQDKLRELL